MTKHGLSLRELYRSLERPGVHPLKDSHERLDEAVRAAYGMTKKDNAVGFLFSLNRELSKNGGGVGPGLPPCVSASEEFLTDDAMIFDGV